VLVGGFSLLLASGALLCVTAAVLTRQLARAAGASFWVFLACASLQLGALASALSVGRRMTPAWWLAGQSLILGGVLFWARRRPQAAPLHVWRSFRSWWRSAPFLARSAAAAALLLIVLSGVRQAVEPLSGFDDRMYHASRVAYWVQNASILPYPTHNERQVAFPFGSELYFLWPVLFTKAEAAGRVGFWLGFPVAAIGVHLLAGAARVREPYRSLAMLLFVSTPIVGSLSIGLAPECWLATFELGTAFWILRAAGVRDPEAVNQPGLWAGLFLVLALNVKTTAVGLVLPVLLLPLAFVRRDARRPVFRSLALGGAIGILLSGMALNFVGNVLRCGCPVASPGLREVVRSELTARQLYIHAVRMPFLLLEAPWIPDPLRGRLETRVEAVAEAVGATRTISLEDSKWPWPGQFRFTLPARARYYSLGGILWLPGLACALFIVLRNISSERMLDRRCRVLLCTLLALTSLIPVVFGLRWMAGSEVPVRFLVAPWALGVVLLSELATRGSRGSRALPAAACIIVGAQVIASLWANWAATRGALRTPLSDAILDEPFAGFMPDLPAGSRILLFADQDTRDYPLFRPREGFPNRVIAWGGQVPTPESVVRRAHSAGATHVLFAADAWLSRHWEPPVRVAETIAGLAGDPAFHGIPSATSGMRLFEVVGSGGSQTGGEGSVRP